MRGGPRLVLRADAGHRLGSGHVMRLTALADEAIARNGEVMLIVGGEPGPTLDALATRRIATVPTEDETGSDDDRAHVIAQARALGATVVVLDGPSFSDDYVRALADAGLRVVSMDDTATTPPPSHVVVNHNLGAEAWSDRYPASALRLLGRPYFLLRREFRRMTAAGPPIRARARRVLVTMGGSDPVGATARVVGALARGVDGAEGDRGLELVIVLGPAFHAGADLTHALRAAEGRGHRIECLYRPPDLPAVMASCDLAVASAGGTLAELSFLGRPTVAVAIVADQVANAHCHAERGLVVGGRRLDATSDAELADAVASLLADEPRRRRLRDACAATVDGRGAERVLERIGA